MTGLIRDATVHDLAAILDVEQHSYLPELQAPPEILEERLTIVGIRVAQVEGKIAGFYTSVPIVAPSHEKDLVKKVQEHRHPHYRNWFVEYQKLHQQGGKCNALYVTSTAVHSSYQGRGIGKALIADSLEQTKRLQLAARVSVLRILGYQEYAQSMDAAEYLYLVKNKMIVNRTLQLYLKLGFTFGAAIPEYENDAPSVNYGVMCMKKMEEGSQRKIKG